ncbi:MAG TPA: hypothetical protein VN688_01200 [Gemmataceae bacterium]|nr:hypothetical protein [Gemmataceae bacterium]
MNLHDKAIRRFRRHLAALFILKYALPLATVWAFVWGIAVLALRAAVGVERRPLLWGLMGLAGCVAAAVVLARRRLPSDTAVRALLDEQSGCGGLLMADGEQELGGWRQKLPILALPRIHWNGRRAWTLLAIAVGFVLLSFLAPQGLADLSATSPLEIDREVTHLIEQIALLKAEALLDPARAESLKDKLAELREHSSGKDPSRTLEALDHLRNLTGATAREAAEKNARANERLGEAQALAEVLRKSADMLSPKLKMEALAELAGLMDKSGLDVKQFTEHLDAEQLKKLAEALQSGKIDLARQVEKMHKAGLIDAELLSKCLHAGECDCDGLRAFLQANEGKVSLDDLKSLCKKGGRGGVNRGPGAAPLTWDKPGSQEGFKFKEEVLPSGALASLKSSPTNLPANRSAQIVIHAKPDDSASSGALREATAGSGSANTDIILPRHRAAVERYFERKSSPLRGKPSPLRGKPSPLRGKPSPLRGKPSPLRGKSEIRNPKSEIRKEKSEIKPFVSPF